nr:MAG TPA: hypothetical protein [Caudoviricetes sp.]
MIEVVFTDGTVLQFPDRDLYSRGGSDGTISILRRGDGLNPVATIPERNILYIRRGDENVSVYTRKH